MQYGKDWDEPIIFQHNGTVDKVYVSVDRKGGNIIPRFQKGRDELVLSNNDTRIVLTLPVAMNQTDYKALIQYCKEYTLTNTHISYEFHFNDDDNDNGLVISLPAQHPISKDYKNPNSINCYDEPDFYDFLNDLNAADSSTTFHRAVNGFREIKQKDNRFEYLKTMTLKHDLTKESSIRLYTKLKASMQPMSKISDPYDAKVKSRKNALLSRYLQIKPSNLDIDVERAVYVRTKDPKTKGDIIHKDSKNDTRFPYRFEVLAIPIKGEEANTKVISSVNYSTSINNLSYFTSDKYVYKWTAKRTGDYLEAYNIEGIIKQSMAGHDIDYNKPVPNAKLKQECVFICHLISHKIGYSNGYGKSNLVLEPFSEAIAETIQDAILKIPSKPKYTGLSKKENKAIPSISKLVYNVLLKRWNAVQANYGIIDPTSEDYDPWSLSTVFYITRDEELLPLEAKYHISLIKMGTRKQITAMVSDICASTAGQSKTRTVRNIRIA